MLLVGLFFVKFACYCTPVYVHQRKYYFCEYRPIMIADFVYNTQFVILKAFYPLVLIVSYKFSISFHFFRVAASWRNYFILYALPLAKSLRFGLAWQIALAFPLNSAILEWPYILTISSAAASGV